jgi:hypothetical protein
MPLHFVAYPCIQCHCLDFGGVNRASRPPGAYLGRYANQGPVIVMFHGD